MLLRDSRALTVLRSCIHRPRNTYSHIQDFRSSDGLYALVKKQYPDTILKGRDLFDASLFRDPTSTSIFYSFISQLKQSVDLASPSRTHRFIRTLDERKKLLRSYTQNIDGLEEKAGLIGSSSKDVKVDGKGKGKIRAKDVRNVQLHGDIHRVRCTLCSADFPCKEEHLRLFTSGLAPDCPECTSRCMSFAITELYHVVTFCQRKLVSHARRAP